MHNAKDEIIYVGKAIVLKNRVKSYFRSNPNHTAKIRKMVSQVAYFEYIVTASETEALVLECNLIKEHRPKYNTMLKDDKSYPYIKVTKEKYPRVLFARQIRRDGARYFGPYPNSGAVKDVLELLHTLFPVRFCNRNLDNIDIEKERGCLYYHMKQCKAPCMNGISTIEYEEAMKQVVRFLEGNYKEVLQRLTTEMNTFSQNMEFEKAMVRRDIITSIKKMEQQQRVNIGNEGDRDVIALARNEKETVAVIFFFREGKVIGREHFHMTNDEGESNEMVITAFVKQFYAGTPYLPKDIFLEYEPNEKESIETWLKEKRQGAVHLITPKKGEKHKMIELAKKNAEIVLREDIGKIKREEKRTVGAVEELSKLIGLKSISRMEAYDISNISGTLTVASMVVFENGKPKRSDYRKFRIRSVKGPDDYASMEEVLTRRFTHGIKEKEVRKENQIDDGLENFSRFPDLIMMDGGKGQVNIAKKVLDNLKLDIPICGMVKDDNHRTRGLYYLGKEVGFSEKSEAFLYVTRMQDEAHRFAIEYHRSLRSKDQVKSILDDIKGIGPQKRKALMKQFKEIEAIKQASIEELMQVQGITRSLAENIKHFFQ